jgi:ATP adenylyltransferase
MTLERLWAGWRSAYVGSVGSTQALADQANAVGCVFCAILAGDDPPEQTYLVWRDERCAAILNLFPYTTGHVMVLPVRHVAELEDVRGDEAVALWDALARAVRALKAVYEPDGLNVGINLGRSAGAGIPGHFHVHCLPRWQGDTNFMTSVAEARVLPESLPDTYAKLKAAWPA